MKQLHIALVCLGLVACSKEVLTHKLSTDASPMNGGTVAPPSNSFEHGQQVSLSATPAGEYIFKEWKGSLTGTTNPSNLVMDADKQVTGVFEKRQYPLTLTIEGNGMVKEEVIAVASQAQYPSGTTVKLTAKANPGSTFSEWKGDLTGKDSVLTTSITKPINLTAKFVEKVNVRTTIKYPLFKESILNHRSGIFFQETCCNWENIAYLPKMHNENPKDYYGGGNAYGDANGDGFQDILVPRAFVNNDIYELRWYINSGDNYNFYPTTKIFNQSTLGIRAMDIVKSDVNNDGLADYIAFGADESNLSDKTGNFTVIIGKFNGTFDVVQIPNPKRYFLHGGAVGDINGDGFVDAITGFYIWYGDGQGNFTDSGISLQMYHNSPLHYGIVDMNKDGLNDIVISGGPTAITTIVLNKNNVFDQSNTVIKLAKSEFASIEHFEVYDLDADGDYDIIENRHMGANAEDTNNFDPKFISSKLFVHINTNLTFTYIADYIQNSTDGNFENGGWDKFGWGTFRFDEIDGDGIDDILADGYHDGDYNGLKKVNGIWKKHTFTFSK